MHGRGRSTTKTAVEHLRGCGVPSQTELCCRARLGLLFVLSPPAFPVHGFRLRVPPPAFATTSWFLRETGGYAELRIAPGFLEKSPDGRTCVSLGAEPWR